MLHQQRTSSLIRRYDLNTPETCYRLRTCAWCASSRCQCRARLPELVRRASLPPSPHQSTSRLRRGRDGVSTGHTTLGPSFETTGGIAERRNYA